MLERYSFSFDEVLLHAERVRSGARLLGKASLYDHDKVDFRSLIDELKTECQKLDLVQTNDLASYTAARFEERTKEYTYADLLNDTDRLIFSFRNELRKDLFFRIPRDKEAYFQQEALFGTEVAEAFPSSADDIQHAGTCFALSQNDACVFHLMRVLERGLNVVAGRVDVSFDRANWQSVIDRIEVALKRVAHSTDVDVQERKLLAQAATHLYFVKGAWRNDVIHGRELCDTGKAMSVLANVTEFMQALAAAGLSELPESA